MMFVRLAVVVGCVGAATAAHASGELDPSQNPLLGTWLLSAEVVNPNLPIRCTADQVEFTPTTQTDVYKSVPSSAPARYVSMGPKIAVWGSSGYKIYTVIDHDHIMLDEIPRCTWERGAPGGQTALLQQLAVERGETAAAPAAETKLSDDPAVKAAMERLQRSSEEIDRFIKEEEAPK
jgi:hypothetical protein